MNTSIGKEREGFFLVCCKKNFGLWHLPLRFGLIGNKSFFYTVPIRDNDDLFLPAQRVSRQAGQKSPSFWIEKMFLPSEAKHLIRYTKKTVGTDDVKMSCLLFSRIPGKFGPLISQREEEYRSNSWKFEPCFALYSDEKIIAGIDQRRTIDGRPPKKSYHIFLRRKKMQSWSTARKN